MNYLPQIRELQTKRKNICDGAGAIVAKIAKEKRDWTAEENQEFERRHDEAQSLDQRIRQLEERQAQQIRMMDDRRVGGREDILPPGQQRHDAAGAMTAEQREVTRRYLLLGERGLDAAEQRDYMQPFGETRALSGIQGSAGAYTQPTGFVYTLDTALKYFGGIIDVAEYIPTEQGNDLPYPSFNDTTNSGEMIQENTGVGGSDSNPAGEQDPAYGVIIFHAYTFDSTIIRIPIGLLEDSAFDAEKYLTDALGTRIGRRLNTACTAGTGNNQPVGILTAATAGPTAQGSTSITFHDLVELEYSVDPLYRKNGTFMLHDDIIKVVRELTDSNGRPLWIAGGVAAGIDTRQPDTLLGHPVSINNDLNSSVTSGTKTILFGQMNKYKIRQVKKLQLVRFQERFMDKLQIGFMAYQRFDGNLVDAGTHPVKYLVQP